MSGETSIRVNILNEAATLTSGDRAATHGNVLDNHEAIAQLWSGYFRAAKLNPNYIDAAIVADLMELLKIARRLNGAHNVDDYVDSAAYAAISGEIRTLWNVTLNKTVESTRNNEA
jgi:hypothetical protein